MSRRMFALVAAVLLWGSAADAQDALVVGTVVDETKSVLPGVTVTATDLATGRQFVAVTTERGEYRLASVPAGRYKLQAELPGFTTVVVPEVELLVGQNRTVPFTLRVAQVSETLTVTGEAPLVDTQSSQIAGNVDRRQMEELPILGRNWMDLAMMVKGITANAVDYRPGVSRDQEFQLNLDGQQITQSVAASHFGQPRLSREAIAEFQIVTNLFDITQGRSLGVQVQAISRAGTNNLNGSLYGNFRDDRFNAADFVAKRVLPYSNQQAGGSIGGPIVRDKTHYFATYEYEREPATIFTQPPALPGQSFSFDTQLKQNSFLARVDHQLSGTNHLMVRTSYWDWLNPFEIQNFNGTQHPTQSAYRTRQATNLMGTWTRVLNSNMIQELKIGANWYNWQNLLALREMDRTPNLVFPGLTLGGPRNYPQEFYQGAYSFRYDLSWHRDKHDFKIGGEFLRWRDTGQWQLLSRGEYRFTSRPADLARRFPADAWNDPTRWDLSGLDPLLQRFDLNFGDWTIDIPRPTWALWIGDTWRATDKLTFNLGVRWDDDWGATAPPHGKETWLHKNNIRDHDNVAPRIGFTYNVTKNNDFVIRGGSGHYYSVPISNLAFGQQSFNGQRVLVNSFVNDGRPGFIQDPTRGLTPEDFLSGRAPLPPQSPRVIAHDFKMPYSWQNVLGFQKQLGQVMALEADLTYNRTYNLQRNRDLNLFYDPVTGYNLNPSRFGRPYPEFTFIQWQESTASANYLALATALNRRYRNKLQAAVTYTVMFFKNNDGGSPNNNFDLDAEWARATDFQRHTLRATAIYNLPWSITLAGAYFVGSGNYYSTSYPATPFGCTSCSNRLRPDGTLVPPTGLKGDPLHKVDLRLTKEFKLAGDVKLAGTAEVFNLFNHANYGAYNGQETTATYGQPRQNLLNAYLPRMAQFAFRLSF